MLKNYFRTALRSLYRNRTSTLINMIGLGIAIACCVPVYHIVRFESSFDHFHERKDRIYRVVLDWTGRADGGKVHFPAADALREDFPEFERITRAAGIVEGKISAIRPGREAEYFDENQILYADQDFLKTLDFRPATAVPPGALEKPNETLLTSTLARKLFSDEDPVGRFVVLNDSTALQVVGILEDPPLNTNLPFHMLVSYATFDKANERRDDWLFPGNVTVYVTVREEARHRDFRERLEAFTKEHAAFWDPGMYYYRLQPLTAVHTSRGFGFDDFYYAPPELLWLPVFLGMLIVIIASINFVNLSMAHALTLARETGIRKVVGSTRLHLVIRFLLQTAMVILSALVIGLLGGHFLLEQVNDLFAVVNYNLKIDASTITFLSMLGVVILLLAGLYPALVVSRSRPAIVFRSHLDATPGGAPSLLRKGLVVIQMGASIVLLVSALVIIAQITFWRDTDLRFRQQNVLIFDVPPGDVRKKASLRSMLSGLSAVQDVSYSSGSPMYGKFGSARIAGTKDYTDARMTLVDERFASLFELEFLAGDNLSATDSSGVLINSKMATSLGFQDPGQAVGARLEFDVLLSDHGMGTIVGVLEDYVNGNPMDAATSPAVFLRMDNKTNNAIVFLAGGSPDIMEQVKAAFVKTYPSEVFSPEWMAARVEENYELELIMAKAVRLISLLSVFISCIGAFGMVSFMGSRRRKEFSVRKVFGASRIDIGKIYAWEFGLLVVAGFAAGAPVAVWVMSEWLSQYKRHLGLDPVHFLEAFLIILLVTTLTTLQQALRSSRVNPAETLRGE